MCFLQLFDFFCIFSSQVLSLKHTHFFSDSLWGFSWKEILIYNFFFPAKFYFYWTILATRVYEGGIYYITRMKNRKQLNIVNCCVLIWFILFWINGRSILLLQFIKTYMLFRILLPLLLTRLGSSSSRKSIFGRLKWLVWEEVCLVHSRRAADEHTDMGSYLFTCYSTALRNGQTYMCRKVTFWRQNLYCHFVIICLIVKMWLVSYLSKS